MWAGALAHAVQLVEWHVQAEEELQCVLGDGRRARVATQAAVQAQRLAHLLEHQLLGQPEVERRATGPAHPARGGLGLYEDYYVALHRGRGG